MSIFQSNQKLKAKTYIDLMMSLFDLKEPFEGSHMYICTGVINNSLIEDGSE